MEPGLRRGGEPIARAMSGLRQFLEKEVPEGIAFLSRTQETLEAYAEVHTPAAQKQEVFPNASEGDHPV